MIWLNETGVLGRLRLPLAVVLAAAAVVPAWSAIDSETKIGPYRRDYLEHWRATVLGYRTASDADLANPHFSADQIRAFARLMEENRLGPFR
jgi:hypothetical protein